MPLKIANCADVPALPVAVKVTSVPFSGPPLTVAVIVLDPALGPSVHELSAATPALFVVTVLPLADDTAPPPAMTANTMLTPDTGFPLASFTITEGAVGNAVATGPVCASPAFFARLAAAPAVPVAPNVTGLPLRPRPAAVRVLVPAVVPSCHAVKRGNPRAIRCHCPAGQLQDRRLVRC